jgi:outer membrane receptor for ferrienterochelin and colicins
MLLFLLSGSMLHGQQANLTIQVRSEGEAVAGAKLTVNGEPHSADAAGNLTMSLEPGTVEITAQAEEFAPASVSITLQASEARTLTLELERHEEEVTVSATRTDVRIDEQPTRVELLNREEIEEKMLMTPGDIVMMLNEMGGLRVQATSPSLGAASVRIQGMRGRYTRFLSDGLPLYGQQVGGLGLLQVPPMDLGQVEVIKGVASSLYGAGAMGGVVNLVSRRPKDRTGEFLVNQTTRGGTDAVFFGSTPLSDRWSMTFLGSGNVQRRQDVDDDGWGDIAHYRRAVLRPRVYWDNEEGSTLFVTAGTTLEEREGGTMNGRLLDGAPYLESLGTRSFDVGLVGQTVVGEKTLLSGRFATAGRNHDHLFGNVRERDHHDTVFAEFTARRSFGRHIVVGGVAFERDAYEPRDFPQFGYEHNVPGFFVQDDFTVSEWLSLSAGGRVDHHSAYGTFFSPRVALLLRKGDWSSRLAAGQGFYAPTPLTEETEAAGLSRLVIPRPLRAERGRSTSFDLTRRLGIASVTVTLFGSRVNDPAEVDRATYELINLARPTTNLGTELLSTIRRGPFAVTASYTYVQSKQLEGMSRVETSLTPKHSAGLVGMMEKHKHYRLGLEVYYTGRQRLEQNPYREISRPYFIVGALVEKRFGPIRAFLNMENLTDIRQTRWDPLLRPTRAIDGRWTVDSWAPLDGRTFNGGIRFSL